MERRSPGLYSQADSLRVEGRPPGLWFAG